MTTVRVLDYGLHALKPRLWPLTHTGPNPGTVFILSDSDVDYQDERNLIVVIIRRVEGIQLPCLQIPRLVSQIIKIRPTTVAVLLVLGRTRKTQRCI